ncbi:GNAT family N-acetyltransferase [Luteimicrobium album]|uniref:GNAT family N-acetyltransferase n=1 Tax=Luteimicrobium album TaxID=1054550 RepID=UPI0024E17FD4|nr:GNAT family N-acetyltransferase [Luteimicrobium album]
MPAAPATVVASATPTGDEIVDVAKIWAAATARRDALDVPEPWQHKLPGIRARLALPHATLFLAGDTGEPAGFALAASTDAEAELYYLAVDPGAWGRGLAAGLLDAVERWAVERGVTRLTLWVLEDNARACSTYARAGWVATDERQVAQPPGRLERRLTRAMPERPSRARS